MGNNESGRWPSGGKDQVEQCPAIDILWWSRAGLLRAGMCRRGSLASRGSWPSDQRIAYNLEMVGREPHLSVHFADPRNGQLVAARLVLVSTPAHYGGVRWWFLCPQVKAGCVCGRRVRKLYVAPRAQSPLARCLACRQCCHLCYTSQREDRITRALSRAQAIRVRLGGSAAMYREFPPKPKHMRWKKYHLLRARSDESYVEFLKGALGPAALATPVRDALVYERIQRVLIAREKARLKRSNAMPRR